MSDLRPPRPQRPGTGPTPSQPWVRVASREPADHSRTSPRMRVDVLQLTAWAAGLYLIVCGIVGLARAGFEELDLFEPVVEVAGLPARPLLSLLLVLAGVVVLAAATGEVDERSLRLGGVVVAVVGVVWLIEPGAFEPYLGVERANGTAALVVGLLLVAASFVPPLSVRRPGV
jgi:drug/metabolite transporter (DMT)-like permease